MEFNEIYTNYHPEIERHLISKLPNQEDAQELASEVFVKVFNNLSEFNSELSGMRTWIWRITNNLTVDYWRKQKNVAIESIDETYDGDSNEIIQLEDDMNPLRAIESSELGESILNAMTELPSTISEVAEMYFIDEKQYKEIADDLSIPMGTVKAHINRARKFLRNRLMSFK